MRLSWNEIGVRAARIAEERKGAHYERGESQTFYNEFFEVFGVTRRRVASFEEPVKKLGDERGFIDLFWKGVLLVEHKSAGRDLARAKEQALDYFPGLKEHELPRYVLVSDFRTFELYDLEDSTRIRFWLQQFPERVEDFGFILGVQKRTFRDQDPVNIKASEMMGNLHDALKESGYVGHNLERFLVRLVFCLFADDTGIFEPRDIFSGHYIFSGAERAEFLRKEPGAVKYLHPYVGSVEFINGGDRWILYLADVPPNELRAMPAVRGRIAAVRVRPSSCLPPAQPRRQPSANLPVARRSSRLP